MRVYHRETQQGVSTGGGATVWTNPVPTAVVTTRVPGGAAVQAGIVAVYDAAYVRLYFDTTNTLYTIEALYQADFTITIAGTVYTTTDYYIHCTPSSSDLTPTGPPTLGIPSMGEEQATVPVTQPTDADFATTIVSAIPVLGGTVLTGTGAGTSITITDLTPGILYAFVGHAFDIAGNRSAPSNIVLGTTLPASDIAYPAYLKWWVNDEDDIHEHGPEVFDPSVTQAVRFFDLGRGRVWSLMLECHEPVFFGVRGFGGRMQVPGAMPAGQRHDIGT